MKRRKTTRYELTSFQTIRSVVILVLFGVYMVFLVVSENYLEQMQDQQQEQAKEASKTNTGIPKGGFIIFENIAMGQGTGNVISGLLAAHLLGLEFDRLVCVRSKYTMFHETFESIDPRVAKYCPDVLTNESRIKREHREAYKMLVTYMKVPDECELQELLASKAYPIVILQANTYPRWPHVPSKNLFFQYYRAKQDLLDYLPYTTKPSTVVHLRVPDSHQDERKGLDEKTLQALGNKLPRDTYLVTNQPSLYEYFEKNFSWQHPNWKEIIHSGMAGTWEDQAHYMKKMEANKLKFRSKDQNLMMWADWYSMLTADKVYHTHSDFSISAIHWNSVKGYVIQGTDASGRLLTTPESWLVDGETPALKDRRRGGEGKGELRNCAEKGPSTRSKEEKLRDAHLKELEKNTM